VFPGPHYIKSNSINMAVFEQGTGPAIVLLQVFPNSHFHGDTSFLRWPPPVITRSLRTNAVMG
jgi:hypothetical protein